MPLIKRGVESTVVATPEVSAAAVVATETEVKPVYTGRKASSDTMSKEDWANKDKRISLQGVLQALLGSVNFGQYCVGTTSDEYLVAVEKASLRLAKFVSDNGK